MTFFMWPGMTVSTPFLQWNNPSIRRQCTKVHNAFYNVSETNIFPSSLCHSKKTSTTSFYHSQVVLKAL
jgi:hypothetical protein